MAILLIYSYELMHCSEIRVEMLYGDTHDISCYLMHCCPRET
jgi:hypothetical protein